MPNRLAPERSDIEQDIERRAGDLPCGCKITDARYVWTMTSECVPDAVRVTEITTCKEHSGQDEKTLEQIAESWENKALQAIRQLDKIAKDQGWIPTRYSPI